MGSYSGQFKNIQEETYTIEIESQIANPVSETIELTFGETPCVITTESDGMFSPIKSRSCTIDIITDSWLFDLYSPTAKGVQVRVKKGMITQFFGYLTPNSYNQSYTYRDNVSLEAIDAVSVLKEFKYTTVDSIPKYQKIVDIIIRLLYNAGYDGMLYIPNSYTSLNGSSNSTAVHSLYVSEGNFFDDDDEHTPWTQYEVLEEGNGKSPSATDIVRCHYEGRLIDGTVFDSSYKRGEPSEFALNQVIKGWTEGLQLMKEGSKYRFYIPYYLAYGTRGVGNIPPYAALIFDVELIEIK